MPDQSLGIDILAVEAVQKKRTNTSQWNWNSELDFTVRLLVRASIACRSLNDVFVFFIVARWPSLQRGLLARYDSYCRRDFLIFAETSLACVDAEGLCYKACGSPKVWHWTEVRV